jgi:uncharacterized alpha-E superfamily protein
MLSRVASNLYWMSRYVERAENTARVLDVAWRMSLLVKEPALQDQEWFAPLNITGTLFPFSGATASVRARSAALHGARSGESLLDLRPARRRAEACALGARHHLRDVEVLNSTVAGDAADGRGAMESRGVSMFFDWVKERSHLFRAHLRHHAPRRRLRVRASARTWSAPTHRRILDVNTTSCCRA